MEQPGPNPASSPILQNDGRDGMGGHIFIETAASAGSDDPAEPPVNRRRCTLPGKSYKR